ncbi:hypothetical protein [uncultured Psychrobacter sp.]|uniref:hypothetical protein n=1 Tax=uncultured Psychrobacter sp. TaxID=259303 RepID=UPI003458E5B7
MSILIGVGVVGTVAILYLGKKGWHALHNAVGITPGILTYQDPHAPLSLANIKWQQLKLDTEHLKSLSDIQLRQLQRIDEKIAIYSQHQQSLDAQNRTLAVDESQVVLQRLLYTRLPEMLASYHHLGKTGANHASLDTQTKAKSILQEGLDNIEKRLDKALEAMENRHLQDLQVMRRYLDDRD